MNNFAPRNPSPLGGRRPSKDDLAAVTDAEGVEDLLPASAEQRMRMLIVGINPGMWTAAVNAPFARPGNRFWPSLHRAGLTQRQVDAAAGLAEEDAAELMGKGIGITNLVARPTVKASELSRTELRQAGQKLISRVTYWRPATVAIAGITAFRSAYHAPKARLGRQDPLEFELLRGWPAQVQLWVVPQPSGLNAHENIDSLAAKWRAVWESA